MLLQHSDYLLCLFDLAYLSIDRSTFRIFITPNTHITQDKSRFSLLQILLDSTPTSTNFLSYLPNPCSLLIMLYENISQLCWQFGREEEEQRLLTHIASLPFIYLFPLMSQTKSKLRLNPELNQIALHNKVQINKHINTN